VRTNASSKPFPFFIYSKVRFSVNFLCHNLTLYYNIVKQKFIYPRTVGIFPWEMDCIA
jgi:hypothetical protein